MFLSLESFQPMEVFVDDDSKLTLHGLQQHYVKLKDNEKNRKLFELLDVLEFNQVNDVSGGSCISSYLLSLYRKLIALVKYKRKR